uniref:Uncharacterized protein n=1 Tax=Anguilla anguilla TaxID=7936 RepID=A0A0E9TN37_ANGAN
MHARVHAYYACECVCLLCVCACMCAWCVCLYVRMLHELMHVCLYVCTSSVSQ